jgi:hypothetical protein
MKKKGAGRPPLPKDQAKSNTLLIRLSGLERQKIDGSAMQSGERPSAWARRILLEAALD